VSAPGEETGIQFPRRFRLAKAGADRTRVTCARALALLFGLIYVAASPSARAVQCRESRETLSLSLSLSLSFAELEAASQSDRRCAHNLPDELSRAESARAMKREWKPA